MGEEIIMFKKEDIRNFYFEDEKGRRIDCQKINGNLFLFDVKGLGYEEEITYEQVGASFVEKNRKIKQNVIEGTLEFYDMSYNEYIDFVNFINGAQKLCLIYVPKTKERIEYYRDIDFAKIEKTEEDDFNVLSCPISLNCKSLWYKKKKMIKKVEASENEMRWDFEWDAFFMDYYSRSVEIINDGHVESPIEILIEGPVLNPKIELFVEGETFQTVTLNTNIKENELLLYGTGFNNFYITKQNENGENEDLRNLDVLVNFEEEDEVIRLPRNQNCQIRLTADNDIIYAEVSIFIFYKTI